MYKHNKLTQFTNNRIESFGINQNSITNLKVFHIIFESNNFDNLSASRNNSQDINCLLLFDSYNLTCDLYFATDGIIGENTLAALFGSSIAPTQPQDNQENFFGPTEFQCECGCGGDVCQELKDLANKFHRVYECGKII